MENTSLKPVDLEMLEGGTAIISQSHMLSLLGGSLLLLLFLGPSRDSLLDAIITSSCEKRKCRMTRENIHRR